MLEIKKWKTATGTETRSSTMIPSNARQARKTEPRTHSNVVRFPGGVRTTNPLRRSHTTESPSAYQATDQTRFKTAKLHFGDRLLNYPRSREGILPLERLWPGAALLRSKQAVQTILQHPHERLAAARPPGARGLANGLGLLARQALLQPLRRGHRAARRLPRCVT